MTTPYTDAVFTTATHLLTTHLKSSRTAPDLELFDEIDEGAELTYEFTNTSDEDRFDPNSLYGHYTVARDFDDNHLDTYSTPTDLMHAIDEALDTDTQLISIAASVDFLENLITHLTIHTRKEHAA